jgi:hypothetical protein
MEKSNQLPKTVPVSPIRAGVSVCHGTRLVETCTLPVRKQAKLEAGPVMIEKAPTYCLPHFFSPLNRFSDDLLSLGACGSARHLLSFSSAAGIRACDTNAEW